MFQGVEEFCRSVGSERLLFASHFPISEPGVVISYLLYAAIGDHEIENIAFRNMERLIEGIRHG
jgi:predicted TIM-barrel fold metal-dependent hydrolase